MRRLNSSILCKEHRVYDKNKEKPIARYGRPICEMLLKKLSKSKCVPLEDDKIGQLRRVKERIILRLDER